MNFEIIPPVNIGDKLEVVGISYGNDDVIRITRHTEPMERPKNFNPDDFEQIAISKKQLIWLAPRLEGLRKMFKLDDGYIMRSKPNH